jgi:hypothetical protein
MGTALSLPCHVWCQFSARVSFSDQDFISLHRVSFLKTAGEFDSSRLGLSLGTMLAFEDEEYTFQDQNFD